MSVNTALLKELFDYDDGNLIWRVDKYRSKKALSLAVKTIKVTCK